MRRKVDSSNTLAALTSYGTLTLQTCHFLRFKLQAEYFSGNMTTTLTFRYTVVEGDGTDSFDILDTRTTNRQKFSTALVREPAAEVPYRKHPNCTHVWFVKRLTAKCIPGT